MMKEFPIPSRVEFLREELIPGVFLGISAAPGFLSRGGAASGWENPEIQPGALGVSRNVGRGWNCRNSNQGEIWNAGSSWECWEQSILEGKGGAGMAANFLGMREILG